MANIALVVLDTLRKDAFDEHFEWLPGLRFENAWAPSHWTVPVHAAMFAGKYPSELGVYANSERLDCPEPVLAERLSETGYTTRGFTTNGNISDHFDFDRGFDSFTENWRAEGWKDELRFNERGDVFDWKEFNASTDHTGFTRRLVGTWRSIVGSYDTRLSLKHGLRRKLRGPNSPGFDEAYTDFGATEALEFVEETDFGDEEFFFLNLMEAHNPYDPPEEYQTVEPVRINGLEATHYGPDADPEHIRQAYDDSVRYLSDRYREIFEHLREDFDVVITLSDHGELLGEHEMWEHLCGIYPELIHVPLTVYGTEETGTVDEMVSLIDVHDTVLELAGLDADGRGESLVGDRRSRSFLTEYHGLSRLHTQSFDDETLADIEYLDQHLTGITMPPSFYGHETVLDEFCSIGEAEADIDPDELMAELAADRSLREGAIEDYREMSDKTMERLEDLGYA
jgi:arylsulfatase A-like enzyme